MKMNLKRCSDAAFILTSFLLVFDANAHHSVAGWYGHSIPTVGPTASDVLACIAGRPYFREEQVAAEVPPRNLIASFNSMSGSVCIWNTDGGLVGPYGQALLHDSNYYPPPPHADGFNNGGCPCPEGNPVNPATGNKFQVETDYVGTGAYPLKFVRYYNSRGNDGREAGFGIGWTHTYSRRLLNDGGNIVAIREDGRSLRFSLVSGDYVADATARERLERITSPSLGWLLTTSDDEIELYDDPGKLLSIANRAGQTHTLAYEANGKLASITDPHGRTLTLARDSASRIQSITTPVGVTSYAYGNTVAGNLVTVTYPGPATRTYHYENSSLLATFTGITDENGQRFATYTYDSSGRTIATEHAGGANKVTFVNDTSTGTRNVLVTRFVDASQSAQRSYTYESIQGLSRRTGVAADPTEPCPSCGPAAQTYDANANIVSSLDWNGNLTNYTYDVTRNLETSRTEGLTSSGGTTAQTRTISTEWHSVFRLPAAIAEPLRVTTMVYDPDGTQCGARGALCSRAIQATSDANGAQGFSATPVGSARTWIYTYNGNGSVLTVDGPRTDVSDVTIYTYYPNNDADFGKRGNVATMTNALGHATSVTAYNAHGQPLSMVDANGLATTLTYDARQRLKTRSAGAELTSYDYDDVGQLTRITLPDGSFLTYSYDAAHRLTGMEDNLGNRIAYTLDAMGNRTQEQVFDPADELAQTRSRVFNSLSRLFRELGAQSQTTEYAYDNQGNVVSVKDPLNRVTASQYDALNRLKQVTDPALGITQYAYNGLDALTQVTDPRSLVTGYTVDGLGNLTQQVSPDTGTTVNTYDAAGNLLTQTDAKGQGTTYAYDALNRVTLITFHDGTKQAYAYDQGPNGIGRLGSITETDPAEQVTSQIAYAYDPHGRVTAESRTIGGTEYVTGYRYDSAGRMDQITYPSGRTVTYAFDALGRIASVTTAKEGDPQVVVQDVAYHPFGGVKSYTLGNGQTYARSIDLDGRIASYTLGSQTFGIGYDAASRIEFISELANPSNSNSYGYDSLDRLTGALIPGINYAYDYDAVGNRTSRTAGSSTHTYAYSPTSNRIASITPTSGPIRSFVFDAC